MANYPVGNMLVPGAGYAIDPKAQGFSSGQRWAPATTGGIGINPQASAEQDSWRLLRMVHMRMRWADGEMAPFAMCAVQDRDRVHLFCVKAGQEPIVITEDFGLFPSDTLITQLRLIEGK